MQTRNLNSHFGDCYNKIKPKKKITIVHIRGSLQLRPQESHGWMDGWIRGGPPSYSELDLASIFPNTGASDTILCRETKGLYCHEAFKDYLSKDMKKVPNNILEISI